MGLRSFSAPLPAARLAALALALLAACDEPAPEPLAPEPSAPAAKSPTEAPRPPRLALWVLCEGSQRVLDHPDRLDRLLEDARTLGATDLFVQVYRGGRAWFDSSLADAAPYRALVERTGQDSLAELLARAHAEGLRVHAWVNVLSLARNRRAPLLEAVGRDAVQVDRRGRSLLDWPDFEVPSPDRSLVRMGTPGVWLDPAAPRVVEQLAATFAELVANYPDLDGLHMDYLRYPDVLPFSPGSRFEVGIDFGYGTLSRVRFETETGLRAPSAEGSGNPEAWDEWRREQVTALLAAIRTAVQAEHPDLLLSAAVSAYPERAYLSLFQDWRGWLETGLLDLAVAMLYSRDDRLFRYEANAYTQGIGGERVWIGIGAWLFVNEPARAVAQRAAASAAGASGIALFSWDALADAPALREALAVEPTRAP